MQAITVDAERFDPHSGTWPAELEGRVVIRGVSAAEVTIKKQDNETEASFRRAWEDMLAGRVGYLDDLWGEIEEAS